MAGRKPKNTNAVFKEKKESSTVVVVHQSTSSTTKSVAAKPPPQKRAPAEKKAVEKPAERQQRKPSVKQLEKKLGEHLEKADKLYKDLAAARIGEQEKKKAPTPKKPQPAVVVKIYK